METLLRCADMSPAILELWQGFPRQQVQAVTPLSTHCPSSSKLVTTPPPAAHVRFQIWNVTCLWTVQECSDAGKRLRVHALVSISQHLMMTKLLQRVDK
jgi:hypothetical protein